MDGGRAHTLAIFRATAAMLVAACVVLIVALADYRGEVARRVEIAAQGHGELAP